MSENAELKTLTALMAIIMAASLANNVAGGVQYAIPVEAGLPMRYHASAIGFGSAIRGGCRFYAGYPITPQSEILEWMAYRMKEVGGSFIQGESEIASVNMVMGALDGVPEGGHNKVITDITYNMDIDEWNAGYLAKMRRIMEEEQRWEELETEDADLVFVAYGISARIAEGAVTQARKKGMKLGLIRPQTLWPYPRKAFEKLPDTLKGLVTVEMNMMGQMQEDVIIACKSRYPVYTVSTAYHTPQVDQLVSFARNVLAGNAQIQEVF